ncbi:hypothetical protein PENTCL1PPCAC_14263, partial [Pristionchus entomophagus]
RKIMRYSLVIFLVTSAPACIPMKPTEEGIPASKPCKAYVAATAGDIDSSLNGVAPDAIVSATSLMCPNNRKIVILQTQDIGGIGEQGLAAEADSASCVDGIWQGRTAGNTSPLEDPTRPFSPPIFVACFN